MHRAFFVMLCLLITMRHARADDAAMLFFVSGSVTTKQGAAWKPARSLQRLNVQDQVRCGPDGQAGIVLLASGARFKLTGGATATVQANTVQGAQPLRQIAGLSENAARQLANSRTAAMGSRGSEVLPQDLSYHSQGWLPEGTRRFSWEDQKVFQFSARSYSFTLFDLSGNVLWSERTAEREAVVPEAVPNFRTAQPYLWRLSGYGASGRPVPKYAWGFVTFLTPEQGEALESSVASLRKMLAETKIRRRDGKNAQSADGQFYASLIADQYRQYGVLMGAYDTWYSEFGNTEWGIREVRATIADAGSLAQLFYRHSNSTEGTGP